MTMLIAFDCRNLFVESVKEKESVANDSLRSNRVTETKDLHHLHPVRGHIETASYALDRLRLGIPLEDNRVNSNSFQKERECASRYPSTND